MNQMNMKKSMYLLITVLFLLFVTPTATEASNEKHNILYISSYSPSFMTLMTKLMVLEV